MADVYYVDTSALSKRYLTEIGSAWLRTQLDPSTGCTIFIARVTSVELFAALSRRERGGAISATEANIARTLFQTDLNLEYQVIEITKELANRAMMLAHRHGLRGYDAMQLAGALQVNDLYRSWGQPIITLLSSDAELNTAAIVESLLVEDPNTHP